MLAVRQHPRHRSGLKFATSLLIQIASWQISRLVDRGTFDPQKIEINPFELTLPRLDPAFDGFRLVHITDIHMGTWMNVPRLEGIITLVNDQSPDVVVITGDFLSYTVEQPLQEMLGPLSRLTPKQGSCAFLGNHDCWTDPEGVRAMLGRAGIRELQNAVHTLRRGAACLHIAGVDDTYDEHDDLPKVLGQISPEGAAILLAHEPDFADEAAASGRFGLQLSGHSHGGQIILPLIGSPLLPRLARKYPRGQYQVNGMQLYTNRGLGTTALQLRIRCPQEIAVITLRSPVI